MKKILFPVILVFLFHASLAAAANADNAVADKIQKTYAGIKGFDADFEQTLTHKESGAIEKRKGRLSFLKPLFARWETAKPHEESLIINNSEIWDYIPDEAVAYRYSPDLLKDSQSIIHVLTGQAKLTTDFKVKPLSPQNGLARLQLLPNEPTTQMVEAVIWVDPDKGLIKQARVNDFYGNSNEVKLLSIRPQNSMSAEKFKFFPPQDVEIEDRMDTGPQGKELFK